MKEKKDRVDDALRATRAAIEERIVPGGGVAYIRALDALECFKGDNVDETTGIAVSYTHLDVYKRQVRGKVYLLYIPASRGLFYVPHTLFRLQYCGCYPF